MRQSLHLQDMCPIVYLIEFARSLQEGFSLLQLNLGQDCHVLGKLQSYAYQGGVYSSLGSGDGKDR